MKSIIGNLCHAALSRKRCGLLVSIGLASCAQLAVLAQTPPPNRSANINSDCANTICETDLLPKVDGIKFSLWKRNNRWYKSPRIYGGGMDLLGFYWPEIAPTSTEVEQIFRRGNTAERKKFRIQVLPQGQKSGLTQSALQLKQAESDGKVLSRTLVSENLQKIVVKPSIVSAGSADTFYVASSLRDAKGEPPVARCFARAWTKSCTVSFNWVAGLHISASWDLSQAESFDQIYPRLIDVIETIEEVKS